MDTVNELDASTPRPDVAVKRKAGAKNATGRRPDTEIYHTLRIPVGPDAPTIAGMSALSYYQTQKGYDIVPDTYDRYSVEIRKPMREYLREQEEGVVELRNRLYPPRNTKRHIQVEDENESSELEINSVAKPLMSLEEMRQQVLEDEARRKAAEAAGTGKL